MTMMIRLSGANRFSWVRKRLHIALQVSCVDLSVEQDWNRPVRLVELGFVLASLFA